LLTGFNDLGTRFPEIASQWHPTKNGGRRPTDVQLGTPRKVWWLCDSGHEWNAVISSRKRSGCPRCAKAGYDSTRPSKFYFIEHHGFQARKIGIANDSSDRLDSWIRSGWEVIWLVEREEGLSIQSLETRSLRWIRQVLKYPPYLANSDIGAMGGGSETFTSDGLSNAELIERFTEILAVVDVDYSD
jgi:hypothetical protein